MERSPVTTEEELRSFDPQEIVDGYIDGANGEPAPGDNRSKAYWHGWRNGRNDLEGKSDQAQRDLIRNIKANRQT